MRQFLINKWIIEINLEIEKAKKNHNVLKIAELKWLKDDLLKLLDKIDR